MSEVENIVRKIIETAPPGNDSKIIEDIKILLNNSDSDKLISNIIRDHYTREVSINENESGDIKLIKLPNDKLTIISKYNLNGIKFFDIKEGIVFDYDFINNKIIDIEKELPGNNNIDYSSVSFIQNQLNDYIKSHYNQSSYGIVIPFEGNKGLTFIIIGEKLNDSNYYNGKWLSIYQWNVEDNELTSIIKVKIHYYEDGNVILNSNTNENLGKISDADTIIDKITEFEKNYEIKILQKVNILNEEKFKNLRRLLPINRTKIQWGRSIGNYKLGQDVVGGRH